MSPAKAEPLKPEFKPEYRGLSLLGRIRRDPLHYFLNLGVKNGPFTWLSLLGSSVLFLNDARAIEYVFAENDKNYHKGKYNEGLRPLLGYGVFLSEDALWYKQRRDTAPIFAGGHFPDFAAHMAAATDAMLKRWEIAADSGMAVDINAETMRLTLDVVLRALYHEESEEALANMKQALGTMLRMAEQRIWSTVNLPLWLTLKLPKYRRTMAFLEKITKDLTDRRRQNGAYPDDLLSRLIAVHEDTPADRKLLRDNVLSYLLAGHETTANGLAWTFYELGRHQEIRDRVVAEVDRVLPEPQTLPDMTMVKSLDYLRQAFSEALRLYPPVWTMSRRTLADDTLPLEDGRSLFVPRDTTVMLCTYSVHRRETYWSDPESFTPSRFEYDAIKTRPKFSWFPFGGGPRLCLGFRFAEVESVIALAMAYRRFNLELIPGQGVVPEPIITLRPDRPIWFRVTRRAANAGETCTISDNAMSVAAAGVCPFGHRG